MFRNFLARLRKSVKVGDKVVILPEAVDINIDEEDVGKVGVVTGIDKWGENSYEILVDGRGFSWSAYRKHFKKA